MQFGSVENLLHPGRTSSTALLFNVSDIVSALERIERLPGEDDGEEEADGG
jgi:hypothetical protein